MNPAASSVAIIFGAVVISGLAWAQQGEQGGPTPSPQGAAVHFVGLNDEAKLPTVPPTRKFKRTRRGAR
jgi:hypothetical protein